jgi:dTDP-4-dehydrorhamnose reductase
MPGRPERRVDTDQRLSMKVLITGGAGQVARELRRSAPSGVDVLAPDRGGLNIADAGSVRDLMSRQKPEVVINAAAYTAVDAAERETEIAQRINCDGARILAECARDVGARFIHLSTDYIFGGNAAIAHRVNESPAPMNAYGMTKWRGEQAVRQVDAAAVIVRTSWVYSIYGTNFVKSILNLAKSRENLRIVSDQIGAPTWAFGLAGAIWRIVERGMKATTLHWSDSGVASWFDFAVAIQEIGVEFGLLNTRIPIDPIMTADYPTPARRPLFSVLDLSETWPVLGRAPHWRSNLRLMLEELKKKDHA